MALFGLILTVGFGVIIYTDYKILGFPDGHLTEFEQFLKSIMYPVLFIINCFFYSELLLAIFETKERF